MYISKSLSGGASVQDFVTIVLRAGREGRRFDQLLFACLIVVKLSVPSGVFAYAAAGVTAIGAICGIGIETARLMLCDFYKFALSALDRFVSGGRASGVDICGS